LQIFFNPSNSNRYEYLKCTLDQISTPELFEPNLKLKETDIEEKLACCHVTAADLAKVRQEIKELEILSQKIDDTRHNGEIEALQNRLRDFTLQCNDAIRECQTKMASLRDLSVFINDELHWLKETKIAITAPQSLPLHVHEVQKLLVKLNMLDDEATQRADALDKLLKNNDEKIQSDFRQAAVSDLDKIRNQLRNDFDSQKELMTQALKARQTYAERLNSVSGQLGSAAARLDLIESDCNGFVMPDQDELKFTDREIDDVQSLLLDKFTEFEAASQCLSLAPSTNVAAIDRVKEALVIIRQKAEGIILHASGMKSEIHDAAAAWQSCEMVIGEIREELQMADQFCNNYKDACPQSHLEAVNLSEAFKCYTDEMAKCCEDRLDELDQVAAALGGQQSLMSAHEALQERWEATKKNASNIGM